MMILEIDEEQDVVFNCDGRDIIVESTAIALLSFHEVVFPYFKDDTCCLAVTCNDVFAWACADAEAVESEEELISLTKEFLKDKKWGYVKWVSKKRNMKPQRPLIDMMINQWLEISRGASRHGSCGFGMNETVTRSENHQFKLTFENKFMQMTKQEIYEFIISIRDVYFKPRIEELGLVLEDWMVEIYNNESIVMNYIEDLTTMMKMIGIVPIEVYLKAHDHVIFEGAQGLGLDQTHGVFPHVTRSNTGMHNVAKYLCEDDNVNIHYMTRSYLTRHGAGPFEEDPTMKFEDLNNVPNEWQGTMKFGVLNVGDMRDRIEIDLIYAKFLKNKQVYINITCLDQVQFFTCKDSKFNKFGNISVLPSNEIGVRDMIETMIPFAKVNKLFYGHNFSDVR